MDESDPLVVFKTFVDQAHLFSNTDKILLAVSGGMDSMAMLHLCQEAGFGFGVAHCNFKLRGAESDEDAQFVEKYCAANAISFHGKNFETRAFASSERISLQMAARQLRYQWFEDVRVCFGYQVLATAHHQDDQVETVLINLIRGTGIAGLHGIRAKKDYVVRPMLCFTKADIRQLVAHYGLQYREDSSNRKPDYLRNRIRNEVVPALAALSPSFYHNFKANVDRFAREESLIQTYIRGVKEAQTTVTEGVFYISLAKIIDLPAPASVLFELLKEFNFSFEEVDKMVSSPHANSGQQFFSSTHRAVKNRDQLAISKISDLVAPVIHLEPYFAEHFTFEVLPDIPVGQLSSKLIAFFDFATLQWPLTCRYWRKGDYFYPSGMKGRKKISDYFIDLKVPIAEKQKVPFVLSNKEIVWIAGYRADERFTVKKTTKKVVKIVFKG